jgi:ribosome-binding factor A
MTGRRTKRIAELIRRELSLLFGREAGDPRFQELTITAVEVTADLRQARVYVALPNDEPRSEALRALVKAAGFFRRGLGERTCLRYVPELHFYVDESLERGARILSLLDQVREETTEGQENDV